MKDEIMERFSSNLERVENLIEVYRESIQDEHGRPATKYADILRSAVVFAHAGLEELLRGLEEWKLPTATIEVLSAMRETLLFQDKKEKMTLFELAKHRGRTVDDVLGDSISSYLEQSNYNDYGQIKKVLVRAGVPPALGEPFKSGLQSMMQRRHMIAHRADATPSGPGVHGRAQQIAVEDVERWMENVREFGATLLNQVRS